MTQAVSSSRMQARVLSVALMCGFLLLPGASARAASTASVPSASPGAALASPEGTRITGDAWTVGPGLATAQNQQVLVQQLTSVGEALCEQMAALNQALQARVAGNAQAGSEMALGAARELVTALERLGASLSSDILATQHNPLMDREPCADMAAALAGAGQQKSREALDEVQEQTLDETRRDGRARNFALAQGQQDYILLDSYLMKDEKHFRPSWLLPASGLITEQARSTYMIGVLANPAPQPMVSAGAADTAGGRRGASALKIKSAQSGVAEGALRFVSQFSLPLTDYSLAVPALEEQAGVAEEDRAPGDELGHSLMQYFNARQRYFSGNLNQLRESALWNTSDTLKHIAVIMAESYHLQLEMLRASLHQTALLATLVGVQTQDQNRVAEASMAPLRQASDSGS